VEQSPHCNSRARDRHNFLAHSGPFERLARQGEVTAQVLTAHSRVSQPALPNRLAVLKRAGLVSDRREERQTP
jgi:DNA-binding transcriptional ArsR family regulator